MQLNLLCCHMRLQNSTSCEALCESTADSSDNVYKDLDWSKYPGYAKTPHTK